MGLACLAGLGAEAVDKFLVVGDFALAGGDRFFAALAFAALGFDEGGVVASVEQHGSVVYVEDAGADIVEEAVVMRDDDCRPGEVAQKSLQPANRENVEVIRWFV